MELRWNSVKNDASGIYVCRANAINDQSEAKEWNMNVVQPQAPVINDTNMNESELNYSIGEPLQLRCAFNGLPRPKIYWYKDDTEIKPDKRIKFLSNNTILDILNLKAEDEGKYKCEAVNRVGKSALDTMLKITSKKKMFSEILI